MNSEQLYWEATDDQFKRKDYISASDKYISIMHQFPHSAECGYAKVQLENIEKTLLSKRKPSPEIAECLERIVQAREYYKELIRKEAEENAYKASLFENGSNAGNLFFVNKEQKKWATATILRTGNVMIGRIFDFSELVDFDVVEDNSSISSGNAAGALVGGLLFGTTGAVVGSATSKAGTVSDLHINLTVNDFQSPKITITLIDCPTSKKSNEYRNAIETCEQIVSLLYLIMEDKKNNTNDVQTIQVNTGPSFSIADEIIKFKNLADAGVITQEEFEVQKQKLLNMDY